MKNFILCIWAFTLFMGCDDGGGTIPAGSEKGPCYSNGTCNPGLVCLSDLCVDMSVNNTNNTSNVNNTSNTGNTNNTSCGNDVAQDDEECDGTDLAEEDCTTLGYTSGALSCTSDCSFDISQCTTCGDNIIQGDEECDGTELGSASCISQGFHFGDLQCDAQCRFDLSGCGLCTEEPATILPIPLDIVVVMDRSGSMGGTLWSEMTSGLEEFFQMPGSEPISAALTFFPPVDESADSCVASSYYPYDVPFTSLDDATPLIQILDTVIPTGITPTYGALFGTLQGATARKDTFPDRTVILVLLTDGDPTDCDTNISSIASLAASAYNYNGVKTYTVALPGSSTSTLQQIAQAGGGTCTTVTSSGDTLTTALTDIARTNTGCSFLTPPEASGTLDTLNLSIEYGIGAVVDLPRRDSLNDCSTADGWYFDDPVTPGEILLCPSTCEEYRADPDAVFGMTTGCPSLTP